jgi:hypothetical protein
MRSLRQISRLAPAACAVLAAALSFAACGDDGGGGGSASTPATSTATTPQTMFDNALWPDPADATEDATPRAVARSFVEDFVGMRKPALGEFQQGDARSGEVPVLLRGEDGTVQEDRVIATIALRQLDGARWFVIAAFSDDVELTQPSAAEGEPMPAIASPVRVAGNGAGFEGNVVLRVHAAFDPEAIAEEPVTAGSATPEPFSADLAFERPASATGAIVARAGGGLAGTTPFAAIGVRFAAG